jgi:hypothetical protein
LLVDRIMKLNEKQQAWYNHIQKGLDALKIESCGLAEYRLYVYSSILHNYTDIIRHILDSFNLYLTTSAIDVIPQSLAKICSNPELATQKRNAEKFQRFLS